MWWHWVGHNFSTAMWRHLVGDFNPEWDAEQYNRALDRHAGLSDFAGLPLELQEMGDTVLRTLARLLQIEDGFCQHCALHGLGHLYHPSVKETVQSYLDGHRPFLTDEEVQYAEASRDNNVL